MAPSLFSVDWLDEGIIGLSHGGRQQPALFITNARVAKDRIPEMTTVGDNNMAPRHNQTTAQHSQKSRPVTVAGSAGIGLRGPHFIKDPLRLAESNKATTTTMMVTPSKQVSNLPPETEDNSDSIKLRKVRRRSSAAEAAGLLLILGEQGLLSSRAPTSTVPTLPPLLADATSSSGSRQSDRREAKVGDGGSSHKPTVRRRLSFVSASDSNLPSRKLATGTEHGGQKLIFPKLLQRVSSSFSELESSSISSDDAGNLATSRQSSFTSVIAKQSQRTNSSRNSDDGSSSGSENSSNVHQWPRKLSVSFGELPVITPRTGTSRTVDGASIAASETMGSQTQKTQKMPPRRRSVTTGMLIKLEDGMENDLLLPLMQPRGAILSKDPREVCVAQR